MYTQYYSVSIDIYDIIYKELWSLVSWLVYVECFHFRSMFDKRLARMNSAIAIVGAAAIIVTLLWVNLSRLFPGLHSYTS